VKSANSTGTPKTRHQQRWWCRRSAKYVSSGGNRDALRRMEGRQASGRSPVDPPEPAVDFAQPQARFRRRGLVQFAPLHEPDHFIDVRKLLARSSFADIRRLASIGTSFARRRSKPTSFRSIADGPSVRRRRSSPQPQEGADRISTSPNDLSPNKRLDDMPLTNCGDIGAR